MNPFSSDKAPYAIALLISALGWAFAALHGGMQDSLVATYAVDRKGSTVVGTVTNLSKTKPIGPVRFTLGCGAGRECLSGENKFVSMPPTGSAYDAGESPDGANGFLNPSRISVEFLVSLPPGGSIRVVAKTLNADPVHLMLNPNSAKPEAIYMLPASHPVAWFFHRYYLIVLTVMSLFLVSFTAWLAHGLLKPEPQPEGSSDDAKPSARNA